MDDASGDVEVLVARGISVARRGRELFRGLDLKLVRGESVVVLGRSGSGKSTMLRALVGLEPVAQGSIELLGRPWGSWRPNEYRRRCSLVMQQSPMFEGTVADNLRYGPRVRGVTLTDETVTHLLERVSLPPNMAVRQARELSGGESQRVAIARALANEPDALLLDEPTSALDQATSEEVMNSIKRLADDGLAVLVVTHDPLVADTLGAKRLWLTQEGLEARNQ